MALHDAAAETLAQPAGPVGDPVGVVLRLRRALLAPLRWSRRRQAVIVAAAVLVIATAVTVTTRSTASTPSYSLVGAALGTLRQSVSATGTIQPAQTANLTFAVAGQVQAVDVTVGQTVRVGQPLARVNPVSLSTQVAQANASVATAQARLTADTNAGALSAEITADRTAMSAAQTAYAAAKGSLTQATLTAPIAGKVAALTLAVGQQIGGGGSSSAAASSGGGGTSSGGGSGTGAGSSGGSSSTGTAGSTSTSGLGTSSTAQVVVIGTSAYQVMASVDDTEVGQVKAGDQAVITPNGSTTPVYGTVGTVGLVPTSTSGVASYPVAIDVTGTPGGLYPGAGAAVTIVVRQLTDVLTVPSAAIHLTSSGAVVYELRNGRRVTVAVTLGLSSGGSTQVSRGLAAGTQVEVPRVARSTTRTGTGTGGRGGGFGGGSGRGTG